MKFVGCLVGGEDGDGDGDGELGDGNEGRCFFSLMTLEEVVDGWCGGGIEKEGCECG